MANIAIITARGGSKRIPRKNIKDFLGKPIIAYSIQAALESKLFDEVMVSTDDEEIALIAQQYGAKVPFMRSANNSDDYATTAAVIEEVLMQYKKELDKEFINGCCIYPTAPFVTSELLKQSFNKLEEGNYDTVFPVLKYSFPIQRSIRIEKELVKWNSIEEAQKRSQDLEEMYHDSGQFYWFKQEMFLKTKQLITDNTSCIVLRELEAQDIDTLEDWKVAEFKYKLLHEGLK